MRRQQMTFSARATATFTTAAAALILTTFASTAPAAESPAAAPTSQPAATQPARVEAIGVERFKKIAADGGDRVVLLDVRTPKEFAEGHIAGAVNLDVQDPQFGAKLAKLDRDKTYLVYCRSGRRSASACGIMNEQRFPAGRQYNLRGGITAWQQAGNPVESPK